MVYAVAPTKWKLETKKILTTFTGSVLFVTQRPKTQPNKIFKILFLKVYG